MTTKLTLRVYFDDERKLGPGKVALLEAVRDRGSILAAARALKMSYRRAWLLVEELNIIFAQPLVVAKSTGATLSVAGQEIVSLYRTAEKKARTRARSTIKQIENSLGALEASQSKRTAN